MVFQGIFQGLDINFEFSTPKKAQKRYFVDRPTGQTGRRIFTHDGSNDAVSRKGVPF